MTNSADSAKMTCAKTPGFTVWTRLDQAGPRKNTPFSPVFPHWTALDQAMQKLGSHAQAHTRAHMRARTRAHPPNGFGWIGLAGLAALLGLIGAIQWE